jgi:hypothetical protein
MPDAFFYLQPPIAAMLGTLNEPGKPLALEILQVVFGPLESQWVWDIQ